MSRPRRIVTTHPEVTEEQAAVMADRLRTEFPDVDWFVCPGMRGIYTFPPPPPEAAP